MSSILRQMTVPMARLGQGWIETLTWGTLSLGSDIGKTPKSL